MFHCWIFFCFNINIKKTFRIYKQSDKSNINQTTEAYVLHFVSEELIYSEQQKISQAYNGAYSTIASSVLLDYLKVPKTKINIVETTKGLHSVVVPLLSPIVLGWIWWDVPSDIKISNPWKSWFLIKYFVSIFLFNLF